VHFGNNDNSGRSH